MPKLLMKLIINVCLLVVMGLNTINAQTRKTGKGNKTQLSNKADTAKKTGPGALNTFEQFYKPKMKVLPGAFPVYIDDDKYYMQIDAEMLNKDILLIGDLKNGPAILAKSSGIIRLSVGFNNNLNVTRDSYSEAAPDNPAMKEVLSKSNLMPVSHVLHIEAAGKKKGSYIIDITQQLNQGGDLFSFQNFSPLSMPDVARSGIMAVKPVSKGVVFTVSHSQTDYIKDTNANKGEDKASTYELELIFQQLNDSLMPVTYSDRRLGFETENYTDFGKNKYSAKKVSIIKKWDVRVKPADLKKYEQGILVDPARPILVYLDNAMPAFYASYVKRGVLQWNRCFEAAGFKNVLQIAASKEEAWISPGKILIKWGNAFNGIGTTLIDDPRTGEILAAKMNVSEELVDPLMPKYFVQCGMNDKRIQQDANSPAVRGDILEFKVAQAMAKLLGMLPNYAGSAAFTPKQIRDKKWLAVHGFTSSVTDDLEFNFLAQPGDGIEPSLLIPSVGDYDKFAINWAYRVPGKNKQTLPFLKNGKVDPAYFYVAEDKRNPATQHLDLSSDNIEAAELGLKNIRLFYPELEKITASMKDDDDWYNFMLIAYNFLTNYSQYVTSVLPNIGGKYSTTVMRNYNDVPNQYVSKTRQQQSFDFLNANLLQGIPDWIRSKRAQSIDGSDPEIIMLRTVQTVLGALVNSEMIQNLIQAKETDGKDAFTTTDLFSNIDHYIFRDFNPDVPSNTYTRALQASMVTSIADLAAKNKVSGGLTDMSATLNTYMDTLISNIDKMCKTHKDQLTRENYKLMKVLLNINYINKQ